MEKLQGVIYILTNPSFPDYVKIGYADDVQKRLKELNRSECIPFAFRLYAYYEVPRRLTDMKLHQMIDKLNPNLRSIEEFDGKTRKREFYNMSAADAYSILETIAQINGLEENLHLVKPSEKEMEEDPVEKKANIVAGEILIPLPLLKKEYLKLDIPSSTVLANIFKVSQNVMEARLKYLKIFYVNSEGEFITYGYK